MCESESGFGFDSGFKAFLGGFGFGFRPQKVESGFGFEKNRLDSDSDLNPDSRFCWAITTPIVPLSYIEYVGFESEFGFKAVGFGFGFKTNEMDSDSLGFGFGFGFEMPGFAHH